MKINKNLAKITIFSVILLFLVVFILAVQFTDTTDSDFNAGIFVNTTVEGTGDSANVTLSGTTLNAVTFDGNNDYLTRGADLTGNADTKLGIVSFWFRTSNQGGQFIWYTGDTTADSMRIITNSGVLKIEGRQPSGTPPKLNIESSSGNYTDGKLHHVMASWDLGATTTHLYIDGINVLNEITATDSTIDYTRNDHIVGAEQSGPFGGKFNGDLGQFYFNMAEYLDLSQASNRAKFYNDGFPVGLGSDGSVPTGTAPIVFLNGTSDQFITNIGGGGGFTENGALTNVTILIHESTGNFTSRVFDAGLTVNMTTISWNNETPLGTTLNISTRTSDDNSTWNGWSAYYTDNSGSTISQNNSARYLQYRAEFSTTDTSITPVLEDVSIDYSTGGGIANETDGVAAIEDGIQAALISGYTNYNDQQVYARNLSGTQDGGAFDIVAKKGNKVWAFNYITAGEAYVGLFNITPVLYVLELTNKSTAEITQDVQTIINATK